MNRRALLAGLSASALAPVLPAVGEGAPLIWTIVPKAEDSAVDILVRAREFFGDLVMRCAPTDKPNEYKLEIWGLE